MHASVMTATNAIRPRRNDDLIVLSLQFRVASHGYASYHLSQADDVVNIVNMVTNVAIFVTLGRSMEILALD